MSTWKERREERKKARAEKKAAKLAKKRGTPQEEVKENPPVQEEKEIKQEKPVEQEEATQEDDDEEEDTPKERKASTKKVYHISYRKETNQWQVKLGGKKVLKLFNTQAEGIEYAKSLAYSQDGSIVIHMKDGTIRKQKY